MFISLFVSNISVATNNYFNEVRLIMNPMINLENTTTNVWYVAIVEANIVNCNANIIKGKNSRFKFKEVVGGTLTTFTFDFEQGLYGIKDFQDELNKITALACNNNSLFYLETND